MSRSRVAGRRRREDRRSLNLDSAFRLFLQSTFLIFKISYIVAGDVAGAASGVEKLLICDIIFFE